MIDRRGTGWLLLITADYLNKCPLLTLEAIMEIRAFYIKSLVNAEVDFQHLTSDEQIEMIKKLYPDLMMRERSGMRFQGQPLQL